MRELGVALGRSAKGLSGLFLVAAVLLVAVGAPVLAPDDPARQVLEWRFLAPGFSHLLGGDNLGRDILSRVIVGARTSIGVAVLVVTASTVIGSLLGVV